MALSNILGLRPGSQPVITSFIALGALAISGAADAADIYAPGPGGYKDIPAPIVVAAPVWTGFYAGINMGAAWSELQTYRNNWNEAAPVVCGVGTGYCYGGEKLNSTTAFGGGQLGYNWQGWGNFVFGLEVDLLGIGGDNQRSFLGVANLNNIGNTAIAGTIKQDGGFAGDVTGRLGYAWGNWLLYAKGGWAWFTPELSATATVYNPATGTWGSFSGWDNSNTLTGWTVGGGLEWMLNPNWSVKVEYQYYDFGLDNNGWNATWNGHSYNNWKVFDNDLTINTVKLGINYHMSPSFIPLK